MILMPQIFNVIANENARYKRNELESTVIYFKISAPYRISLVVMNMWKLPIWFEINSHINKAKKKYMFV